ncbi:MAG: FHA domain-containing protein, partial [Mycobacterium sp.]|nr:FHA domain-containing protein [Mycobacterium sp.]
MSRPAPPMLTIRHDGSQHTFAAGHDVVVGRDVRADIRITDPRISRAHLILRFEQGKWQAIDNGSVNGTYVNGYRMPVIDIHDGQSINIGNAGGPRLTFELGQQPQRAGRPPATGVRGGEMPTVTWSTRHPEPPPRSQPRPQSGGFSRSERRPAPEPAPARRPHPPSYPRKASPQAQQRPNYPIQQAAPDSPSPSEMTVVDAAWAPSPDSAPPNETTVVKAGSADASNFATRFMKFMSQRSASSGTLAGSVTIGRANDNDLVIPDVLASRHHATLVLTPLGTEIRDRSVNGTFVNGTRVGSAILRQGDVVTIGNIDLVFTDSTLVRRTEAATRTGGLEVRSVNFTVDNGKQLLNDISLIARPGTLTAVIGGSGAGKTTLARLIAGYTRPTSGSVTFEGHDIHAEYASLRSRIGMVPQDDVVHRQLTVNQALGYAAELRLPPDTSKADRAKVVAQVLEELDLTKHA